MTSRGGWSIADPTPLFSTGGNTPRRQGEYLDGRATSVCSDKENGGGKEEGTGGQKYGRHHNGQYFTR